MRLLFLCKRRPQARDLIERPYGRFHHLPRLLAERGHEVRVLLLSYRRQDPPLERERDGVLWTSRSVGFSGPLDYLKTASATAAAWKPDWIGGFSDTYYGILAQRLAARHGALSLIDAYDNYESYIPWLKPLHWWWRLALRRATLVTAAGPGLAELMARDRTGPAAVVPMAADPEFVPMDRETARQRLALDPDRPLAGYCGSLIRNRGVEVLFDAMDRLRRLRPDVQLVVSGRIGRGVELPDWVRHLGYLPDADLPHLLNALDVLLVQNRASAFGNHSYPAKLYEAMACRIPAVATDTASTRWILKDHPDLLAPPDDPEALARAAAAAMEQDGVDYATEASWEHSCGILDRALQSASQASLGRR